MAFKKNKKRFDPRYFMNEKMEEPKSQDRTQIPLYDEFDEERQREYLRQKQAAEDRHKEKDVPRGSADVSFELKEGLENITPENLAIVAQAAAIVAGNFAPAVIIGALGMKLKDAIDYLRANSPPEAPPEEELNEVNEPAVFLSQLKAGLQQTGLYSEKDLQDKMAAMANLASPRIVDALQTIADNAQAVGDIHIKLGAKVLSDERVDKLEPGTANLFRILKVLGKYRREWDR